MRRQLGQRTKEVKRLAEILSSDVSIKRKLAHDADERRNDLDMKERERTDPNIAEGVRVEDRK